jgi:hypothetical protein
MNTSSIEPHRGEDRQSEEDRLFHEINLLRLEGYYFCLDPKAASRRKASEEFFERLKNREEIAQRPITISPHPSYGYPSVLAYKVLQAIWPGSSGGPLSAASTRRFSSAPSSSSSTPKSPAGSTTRTRTPGPQRASPCWRRPCFREKATGLPNAVCTSTPSSSRASTTGSRSA